MSVFGDCILTSADSSWNYKNTVFLDIQESDELSIIHEKNTSIICDNFDILNIEKFEKLKLTDD